MGVGDGVVVWEEACSFAADVVVLVFEGVVCCLFFFDEVADGVVGSDCGFFCDVAMCGCDLISFVIGELVVNCMVTCDVGK